MSPKRLSDTKLYFNKVLFLVSRAPGKRKIKVQEENLLRLMQEDDNDDEEDDDFEVSKEQFNQLIDGMKH